MDTTLTATEALVEYFAGDADADALVDRGEHRGDDDEDAGGDSDAQRGLHHGRRNTKPTPRTVSSMRGAPAVSSLRRR